MIPENGSKAPDFSLVNQFGETVSLAQFRGVKPVVLVFYPLAFSGTCTGELCELQENIAEFREKHVELLGISVDSKFTLRAWSDSKGFDFSLLADFWPHGEVAERYGVFLQEQGIANRATFVVDTAGIIRAQFLTAPGEARPLAAYRSALAEVTVSEN